MRAVLRWLHLIGVTFWAGGMFINILVLMPSMEVLSPPERGKMMGAFLKRFAPLAWGGPRPAGDHRARPHQQPHRLFHPAQL